MSQHWELRPKGTQTYVECLNEWKDRFKANIDWHYTHTASSIQTWEAYPEINGKEMPNFLGKGRSKDDAMNVAAKMLSDRHALWRKN